MRNAHARNSLRIYAGLSEKAKFASGIPSMFSACTVGIYFAIDFLTTRFLVLLIEKVGWMTCDFRSFSTVFQTYQDSGMVIRTEPCSRMKRCPPSAEIEP